MRKKKLDELGVSAFCESMAMMLQSGIQPDEAVDLLQSGHDSVTGVLEKGLAVMKEQLDSGSGLTAENQRIISFPSIPGSNSLPCSNSSCIPSAEQRDSRPFVLFL